METDWAGRVPSVFPIPSLYPSFVHIPHFIASCLFNSLCHRRSPLNVCFKSLEAALLLCCFWHMKPSVVIECLDKKTLDDPQREHVCLYGRCTFKGVWSESTLRLITFIRKWWAFEADAGDWFDGLCVERVLLQRGTSYILSPSPIFLLHGMPQTQTGELNCLLSSYNSYFAGLTT